MRDQAISDPTRTLAVVGMAGRFPAAPDVASFWRLLIEGRDAIRPVPPERWDATAQLDPEKPVPAVGAFLDDVDRFDATFFGISPREAEVIDPQQRLMLEVTWQTLEDAGIAARSLAGSRTGVYIGASWHDYEILRKDRGAGATQHSAPGNALDVIAARISYFLGLTGPSMVVETGCSSSLVALHLAEQALRAGQIDAALVGGVNLVLTPDITVAMTHFGGLSPDGRCKTFAESADGFVRGEGAAAVYLKTLARARADGDRVHGLITHTAVNNDGGGESLVTPNPGGQEDLLRHAYAGADVPIDELAYLEAHGTGTERGDPIEAGAIGRVLGRARTAGPLPIGSVKTNIGHLEAAAGMAGLFKALLAFRHRVVPASLNAERLNPEIPFDELNLSVVREPLRLPETGRMFIGINSFGWGGTNAHVVAMNAPDDQAAVLDRPPAPEPGRPVLLPISAHSDAALRDRVRDVRDTLATGTAGLAEVAGTLAWQRDHFPVRLACPAADAGQATERLARFLAEPDQDGPGVVRGRAGTVGRTAFVFPGQGAQWAGMGRDLLAADTTFARVVRRCAEALKPYISWDLLRVVSGAAGDDWLSRVDMVQPMLWAVSVGLAEAWRAAGVEPDVVIGHSQGEVTAATVAGVLSYEDAALAVARRSAIVRRTSGAGRMLVVDLDLESAAKAISGFEHGVSVAANNGPSSCILAGDTELITVLKELLDAEGTFCRLVNVDYASHSPQMDALEGDLLDALAPIRPRPGDIPVMSTVRVATIAGIEMDSRYWMDNLRRPVMFADAMDRLFDDGVTHVVEVSPHPVISPAIEQLAAKRPEPPTVLGTLRRDSGSSEALAEAFARAYVSGLRPFDGLPRKSWAPLPGYPWQRRAYWVEPGRRRDARRLGLDVDLVPDTTEQGAWTAGLELALDDLPWLGDHRVHDAVVLPGAGMLTIALRAAAARNGAVPRRLADIAFQSDLTLTEEPARLAVRWRDDVTEGGSFTLLSLPDGADAWTTHASARVLPAASTEPPAFPAHLRLATAVDPVGFYAERAAAGLVYGPAFRTVVSLRRDEREVLAEVRLGERCLAGARAGDLHPALWDGALQATLPLCARGTVVPVAVRQVHLFQDLSEPVTALWSHAVRRDGLLFDVRLFDTDGRPVMALEGLRLHALATAPDDPATDPARFHRLTFVDRPRLTAGPSGGSWLVCADARDTARAEELVAALDALGASATLAGTDADSWPDRLRRVDGGGGVAFLAPRAIDGEAAQRAGLLNLTELVRACGSMPAPPRIAVVTTDAQAPRPVDRPDPGAAMYWGFGRVLRREHPELRPRLVDVGSTEPDWVSACVGELLATGEDQNEDQDEDQVVLRGGRRAVGRLVRGDVDTDADTDESTAVPAWRTPKQPFRLYPSRPGRWEGVRFLPLERVAPGPGQVEIAVRSASLNFIDVLKAMGTCPDPDAGGDVLGLDAAGVITRVGPGVSGFAAGDRVVACSFGSLASHLTISAGHVQRIPDRLDDPEAAALPLVLTTAWHGLCDVARLDPGETVLIHSAAGGLGLAAVAVARARGAEIIATAGSERKRDFLRGLGITHVFDSRDLSWVDGVRAATDGRGVDVVLNSLTGAAIPLGLDMLAEDGRFVEVGKADVFGGRTIGLGPFRKRVSMTLVDLAGLILRRPDRFAQLFGDVWALVGSGELGPLPVSEYAFADAVTALREMSHGRHIGKIVVSDPDTVTAVAPEPMPGGRFRSDGTYLVSGGLGALGLSLAEFMAERGAGALALLGRSAPSDAVAERVARLRARGVRVEVLATDVGDAGSVERALRRVREKLPRLRGVVHAAGLLDDATIQNLRPDQLDRVLAPKVDGARNLDGATADDPLDFFLLFSSAAALLGNPGQAAYAAGNAYLDALAVARRRRGLPALSVQWGPFTEIGLAAKTDNRGARLADRGMTGFTVAEAWRALERMLAGDAGNVGYVPLDLRHWFEACPDTATIPAWGELWRAAQQDGAAAAGSGSAFLTRLRTTPSAGRPEVVEAKVRELAGRVLRLEVAAIERDTPFKALGLDSLMALELRNRLESTFGLRLSPTLLWTYGNTRALSAALAERLSGPEPLVTED